MSSVDERIVNMKLENKQFLSGVKSSQTALSNLNKSVDNAGNSKGLGRMGSAVDGVKQKFSLMNAAAVTAVATITNKLVNAGLKMAKSLTLDPIMAGFREYQTNLNSIQTIMANTGKKVGVVNKYLGELNEYSDKTIYSFSTMADSIGKFTAAGVKIDDATVAIKGMANSAALGGSNVQQLNMAMYQVSQALSTGTIRLMDWNSVSTAGMGGTNMRKAFSETARTMGVDIDGLIKKNGSFRDSLQEGWFSSEIFTKSMKVMAGTTNEAGDTIAFTVKQLQGMGYTRQAAEDLNKLSKAAINSATKIKTFPQMMDVIKESIGSGWAQVFQNLFGNFNQSVKLWTGVGTKITDVIGGIFDSLNNTLVGWRDLGGYQTLWAGFGNIFQALGNLLRPFVTALGSIMPGTKKAGSGLFAITAGFEAATGWLERLTRGAAGLTPVLNIIASLFKVVLSVVVGVVQYFAALVPLISGLGGGLASLVADLGAIITQFLEWADISGKIDKFFDVVISGREEAFGPLLDTIGAIIAALGTLLKGDISGFKAQFKDALTLLDPLVEKISGLAAGAQAAFAKLGGGGTGVFSKIANALSVAAGKVKEFTDNILGAFDAFKGGSAAAAEGATTKLASATTGVSDGGNKLISVMKSIGSWVGSAASAIATGIGSIWSAISVWLGNINKIDLATTLSYVFSGAMMVAVYKFFKTLQGFGGLGGEISGSFSQLTGTLKTMQGAVKANIIKTIAISVGILAGALWVLSKIPADELKKGLGAITILMTQIVGVMVLLGKGKLGEMTSKNLLALGAALILMSGALINMAAAVAIFGNMEWGTMLKGFAGIAIALALMVGAGALLSKMAPQIFVASAAMVVLSVALAMLAGTILLYDKINWSTLLSGIAKMGVVMLAMGLSMLLLAQVAPVVLVASVALGVLSVTMTMLLGTILAYSEVSWETIGSGLAKISVALIAIGVASLIAAPGVVLLGAGALLLGTGLLAAGIGLGLFTAGLAALAVLGTAAFAVITTAIQVFIAMLPMIAIQVAASFVTFIETMAAAAPRIANAFVKIVSSMIDAGNRLLPKLVRLFNNFIDKVLDSIQTNVPKFGKTMNVLIDTGLNVLNNAIPKMVRTGLNIISSFLAAVANEVPKISRSATDIVVGFINGIANHIDRIINAGTNLIIKFIRGIGRNAVALANAAGQTILDFLNGIDAAIDEYMPQIMDAGAEIGKSIAQGVINGLGDMVGDVVGAAGNLASKALGGIHGIIKNPPFPSREGMKLGYSLAYGFTSGISNGTKEAVNAAGSMGQGTIDSVKRVLDSHSPSRVFMGIGLDVGKGFVRGLTRSLRLVGAAGDKMAQYAIDTVTKTATRRQARADAQAAKAQALRDAAALLRKKAQNKKLSEAEKKELEQQAKRLTKQARAAQKEARATQQGINADARRRADAKKFNQADDQGKSDILNKRAENAAKSAQRLRKEAIEAAKEAELVRAKDAKRADELEKQSQKALKNAEKAARAARANAREANRYAAKAVIGSANDVAAQIKADKAAVALEERLDKMTDTEKSAYYKEQAALAQAEADAKYDKAAELLKKAKREARTNAAQAEKDVAAAQRAVAQAQDAQAKAEEYAAMAQDSSGGVSSPGSPGSPVDLSNFTMPDVAIASSNVYGAQNMFDAYSKALAATASAASGDKAPSVQFVQNNTSPVALSPSEIYRQSKNLLSDAERKLTGALT